jgi:hypothetical protein
MLTSSKTLKLAAGLLIGAGFAPIAAAGGYGAPAYSPDLLPSNPAPGMCYARVEIPAQYTTTTEDVLVEEGYTTVEVTQPKLATRQQQVLVKEASVRYEVRQPSFRSVSEKIMTRPAYDKLTVTPPSFSTVTENMASSAPRLVWKKGNPANLVRQGYKIHSTADAGQYGQGYSSTTQYGQSGGSAQCGATCEIWCLVEEPGESVSFQRKVVSNPARVQRQTVPARYQTIMKQVVSDPGGVREIPVPAQHRTVTVEEIVQPGGERQVTVPPKYGKVEKKQLVSAERYEWRQVACKTGTLPSYRPMANTPTMVTPSKITSAPMSYQQPMAAPVQSSAYGVAPTVGEVLANGGRAVCISGQDCTDIIQSSPIHGGGAAHSGGASGGGYYSHSGSHGTANGGSWGSHHAYESGH